MIIYGLVIYFNSGLIVHRRIGDIVVFDVAAASVLCILLFWLPPILEIFAHHVPLFKPVRTTPVDAFLSA